MATILATYEFKCPTFLVCPLEYGNTTGLSYKDEQAYNNATSTINKLMKDNGGTHYTIEYGDEQYFSYFPDFTHLGCDVVDIKVHIMK